jgi:2-polyprenyl-6-methoxyphenol hydroxylase-like FAD-dependent oxidoreductase
MSDRVLVVGGGIAGLSCAIALRTHGYPVDVVELSGEVEPDSVNLSGRAVDALADLGVLAECVAKATTQVDPVFGNVFDSAGRPRNLARPPEPHSSLPSAIVIYRPVLIDVLGTVARQAGATVRIGCTVTAISQSERCAQVTFDDGTTGEYELVVGADGVHSAVRSMLWGGSITPTYTGALGMRWTAGGMPSGQSGFYYAPAKVVVTGTLPGDLSYVATFAETDKLVVSQEEARSMLCGVLDAYTAPYLRALRDRVSADQQVVTRPWECLWVPDWYVGRVVLIGDAVHATAPYVPAGGGMALIDSVVLAEELAESADIADGLGAFVHRRADRTRLVVETSIEVTRLQRAGESLAATTVLATALVALAQPY